MAKRSRSIAIRSALPNLLILGASGNVARAFLRRLGGRRAHFGQLLLLDKSDHVRHDRYLEHRRLAYRFIRRRLQFPKDETYYRQLLRQYRIGIVLDLTDAPTIPTLTATDAAGVSYVSTSLNDGEHTVKDLVEALYPHRDRRRRAAHILCTGMNPGAVNIWVHHAVRRYGVPREIVHFEYDTSMAADRWRPLITWSRKEFLTETVWEPTGTIVDGQLVALPTNALVNRVDLRPIMKPVVPLADYPHGFLVLHEENVTIGRRLGVSSKFVYAIHPKTMAYLTRRWRERGQVQLADLQIGDNTSIPLTGEDTIGVYLEYPRKRVYYLHTLANRDVVGANATCSQVAVGVYAALFTLLRERLQPRIYFVGDLYDTLYPHVMFCNIRVEYFVFTKRKRSLILREHVLDLRPRFLRGKEQLVI